MADRRVQLLLLSVPKPFVCLDVWDSQLFSQLLDPFLWPILILDEGTFKDDNLLVAHSIPSSPSSAPFGLLGFGDLGFVSSNLGDFRDFALLQRIRVKQVVRVLSIQGLPFLTWATFFTFWWDYILIWSDIDLVVLFQWLFECFTANASDSLAAINFDQIIWIDNDASVFNYNTILVSIVFHRRSLLVRCYLRSQLLSLHMVGLVMTVDSRGKSLKFFCFWSWLFASFLTAICRLYCAMLISDRYIKFSR